jgi:Fe-S-cluster containining protein
MLPISVAIKARIKMNSFESDKDTKPLCNAMCCEIISMGGNTIEYMALKESTPERGELLKKMLRPINMVTAEEGWQLYECTMFDKENRLCTVYDQRPDACRLYPIEGVCVFCGQKSFEEESKPTTVNSLTVMGERFQFSDIVLEKGEKLEVDYERRS